MGVYDSGGFKKKFPKAAEAFGDKTALKENYAKAETGAKDWMTKNPALAKKLRGRMGPKAMKKFQHSRQAIAAAMKKGT